MKTLSVPTDGPSLRLYVISLFTLLQALKFYDFVTLRAATEPQLFKFLAKWFVLDAVFVSVLPFLNIPWLKFRRSSQVLQIAFVFVLNWGLSFGWDVIRDSGLSIGTIWAGLLKSMSLCFLTLVFYNKELGITEKYVDVRTILHNNSHIQGRKVVRILPERYSPFDII
jgi:hypothetical protein